MLKATAEHLRSRVDLAHVWRNIDSEEQMRDAWDSLVELIGTPEESDFVVQRVASPGVPVEITAIEDPFFGPTVTFSIAGPLSDLVGDRSYRIPPITRLEAAEMVREIRAAPLLFGFRGAVPVDVPALEDTLRRVAQLKHDLPQLRTLALGLAHAGPEGVDVLSVEGAVAPVSDVRSDWFVRRLSVHPGDTLSG